MKALHNIEKSGFRKGEYVGYGSGTWRIVKTSAGGFKWRATRVGFKPESKNELLSDTLSGISALLNQMAGK